VAPSDLVQESLFEAHRDFSGFKGKHQLELFAWLRRILLHNLANARRTYQSTLKRAIGREVALDGFDVATGRPIALPQIQSSPSSMVGLQEQVHLLHAAVDRLPEDYKQVILLRHRDHLPFEAIAKQLNRSAAAARKLWSRAIECLQQELTATDDDFRNK
jgi:RNA polymerase sigma-70 factor, ECF subfamily